MKQKLIFKINFLVGLIGLLACTSLHAALISATAFLEYEFSGVSLAVIDGSSFSLSTTEAGSDLTDDAEEFLGISGAFDTQDGGIQEADSEGEIDTLFGSAFASSTVVDAGYAFSETQIGVILEVLEDGVLDVFADAFLDLTDLQDAFGAVSFFLDIADIDGSTISQNEIFLQDENADDGFSFNIDVSAGDEIIIDGFVEAFALHPAATAVSEPTSGMLFLLGSSLLIGFMKRHN